MREHLWLGEPDLPPLEDAWREAAEAELGLRLPAALVDCLRAHNGGRLRFDAHRAARPTSWASDHVPVPRLRGIGPEPEQGLRETPALIYRWGLPQKLVLLHGDGHTWLALDHREEGEPTVLWLDAGEGLELKLADSFADFLRGLVRGERNQVFGFPGVKAAAPILEAVGAACGVAFEPAAAGGHVAEHRSWRSRFGDPAFLRVVPNEDAFPGAGDCAFLLRADVIDGDRPALDGVMARLPIPTVVLHRPQFEQRLDRSVV